MNQNEPALKPPLPSFLYILGVMVLSRLCFWVLATTKNKELFEGLCRWDCGWYVQLATHGYDLVPHGNDLGDAANWAFFPLYPTLLRWAHNLSPFSMDTAGFILSNGLMYCAILVSLRYLHATRSRYAPAFWVWLCAFGPYSFYFSTAYSESLFWLLSIGAMLLWHQRKVLPAAATVALLSATRLFGVFWVLGWLADLYTTHRSKRDFLKQVVQPHILLALCFAPAGLFGFMCYLHFHVGDGLAFFHIQKAWGRDVSTLDDLFFALSFWNDFGNLFNELPEARYAHAYYNVFGVLGICLFGVLCVQRRVFEATIAVLIFLVALKAGLLSLPRFLVGTPVFALALHDAICHYFPRKSWSAVLVLLAVFNFWLCLNWYESAFFLV